MSAIISEGRIADVIGGEADRRRYFMSSVKYQAE